MIKTFRINILLVRHNLNNAGWWRVVRMVNSLVKGSRKTVVKLVTLIDFGLRCVGSMLEVMMMVWYCSIKMIM